MVTLSLPFCLLYLCSVFKVQFRALLRVTLCLMAYVFLVISPSLLSQLGGLKWTRTTDLTLIRRAL